KYEVLKAPQTFSIQLLPLLAVRGYHQLMHKNNVVHQYGSFSNGQFKINLYQSTPDIFIQLPGSEFHSQPDWYYNYHYSTEHYRGLDYVEDLFTPGYFSIAANEGDAFYVVLSTEDKGLRNAILLFENEIE